jgi:hypothetical protein
MSNRVSTVTRRKRGQGVDNFSSLPFYQFRSEKLDKWTKPLNLAEKTFSRFSQEHIWGVSESELILNMSISFQTQVHK